MAELADAHDSNSCELCSCGFDSHLRHLRRIINRHGQRSKWVGRLWLETPLSFEKAVKATVTFILIGLAAGLGLGLLFGWVVWPVEYYDADVAAFHPKYKLEYAAMVGASYELDGNWELAAARLQALQEEDTGAWLRDSIHRAIAEGQDPTMIRHLITLADPLGVKSELMKPFEGSQ